MEIWDLYNENREIIGEQIRGQALPENGYHLVVHVWIRNREGHYLISQRAANRPTFPLMWECVGGSVLQGESSLHGALREVKEEVGITLAPENGTLLFSEIRHGFHDILDVWRFTYDGEVSLQEAETDEVAQSRWMTRDDVQRLRESGKLVETLSYFFDWPD
ncbi:MAG: NUDIX domain-containing protein [Clostridia bacterium]|nr:NUDIX domain-containing protein [Clostridia bacterium]